jgi:hypothetical protein
VLPSVAFDFRCPIDSFICTGALGRAGEILGSYNGRWPLIHGSSKLRLTAMFICEQLNFKALLAHLYDGGAFVKWCDCMLNE